MANLEKIVYLTEAQKETLFTNGTLTANGNTINYNDNDLYITPEETKTSQIRNIIISTSWSGNGPYTQTVTINNYTITANSKVDLQPDATVISQMASDNVQALYIDNNNGTLTAYAVGAALTVALTVQCTVTEVGT